MATRWQLWFWPGLLLVALLGIGCGPQSMAFVAQRLFGADDEQPPTLKKIASGDKDKEVKVVILAYCGLETRPEFITADQELSGMLAMVLQESYKRNKQKVTLVPAGQVKKYKDNHPNWYLDLNQVGKHFDADYVIYLQIESLSLYEQGSANQLYRGRSDIQVSLLDMHDPDGYQVNSHFRSEYPRTNPVSVDDRNGREFLQSFLQDVARHLSWYFSPHPVEQEYDHM